MTSARKQPQIHDINLLPYTYLQCPCSDVSLPRITQHAENTSSDCTSEVEIEQTFDPRAARSNYCLYPIEHLLYCEDCRQIRCPRCSLDEIVTWYCPNCLFEVPSSTVKSEGNRCTRSCFQCPICIAPLSVTSLEPPENQGVENATSHGPFILNCAYCMWTTKEIGIFFEKQNGIYTQLSKIKNEGLTNSSAKDRHDDIQKRQRSLASATTFLNEEEPNPVKQSDPHETLDAETHFSKLGSFYRSQLAESTPVGPFGLTNDFDYSSPGTLSRIMGLYSGAKFGGDKSKTKANIMREACEVLEGLQIFQHTQSADKDVINNLRSKGWHNTTSYSQRKDPTNSNKRFISELRPIAYLLRTKRSKRCRTCRQILSRPDAKVHNTRFRIRMIASNYIPSISIRPLQSSSLSPLLTPMKPVQFLLTCKNPLFDKIRVTLATPSETSGKQYSKTTILCPQFEVGANLDVWDEALQGESDNKNGVSEKRRTTIEVNEGQQQAEAGKVWERGRNWVSVVLEVLPSSNKSTEEVTGRSRDSWIEDDDICDIPVFVRVEWETDPAHDVSINIGSLNKAGGTKETRELAYWCVLGVGRTGRG
ncbi:Dynactin subunit 4 [Golovinomyces cichoracearum]|uniref:Dynactin subunit 4 n=1 Tax=Golovinomyces cichoracearum TaxID=62708 RepID=A0A420IRK2_9PEZI|nr:Dynactin subunit 4 [Golovinomyces cichoracearum]